MTKQDYIKLAKVISENDQTKEDAANYSDGTLFLHKSSFIVRLCDVLAEDNPQFDQERFIAACQ